MFLIVGLGNPGRKYQLSRHNAGFMMVDRMAREAGLGFREDLLLSLTCRTDRSGQTVILAKPQTFMNRSGAALCELVRSYPVERDRLLIVYDELALPLGKLRLRRSGSSGGHRGMQSVIEALGTEDVPRLRIGIGPEVPPEDAAEYVLESFSEAEQTVLEAVLDRARLAVDTFLAEGLERAMSLFNRNA